jgi:hypothetical protein
MGRSYWSAAPDGTYWLDVAIDQFEHLLMLDTVLQTGDIG